MIKYFRYFGNKTKISLVFGLMYLRETAVVIQSLSSVQLFAASWIAGSQFSLSLTISQSLLKLMSIESVMLPHLCLISSSASRFSSCPQSFHHQGLCHESVLCIRWPNNWSFSFSISPSNEYLGLITFMMDWFDLLTVQGTQESSPTSQLKSINSLALSFLYGPALTSIYDYWKNHSFDRDARCHNHLLCKLVAHRYSVFNQHVNVLPKITLNGFNILLELTWFIFLNYLRQSYSKVSQQTKI